MPAKETQNPFNEQGKATGGAEKKTEKKPAKAKTVYKRVKFHNKSTPNQPNDVILSVNGDTLQLQRNVEVVLPQYFLEAADHATYPQFQTGSGSRKQVAEVRLYPYDYIGEGTEEEYKKMLGDGTKRQAEARDGENIVQSIRA